MEAAMNVGFYRQWKGEWDRKTDILDHLFGPDPSMADVVGREDEGMGYWPAGGFFMPGEDA